MFSQLSAVLLTASVFVSSVCAAPLQGKQYSYTITSQTQVNGAPWNGGAMVGAGGTLTYSKAHEVGVSVEVGVDLGLDFKEIWSLGLSVSVAYSTSDSVEASAQYTCPTATSGDQMMCSLMVTPHMLQVGGVQTHQTLHHPYQVTYPRLTNDGNLYLDVELCVCGNYKGWASLAPVTEGAEPQRWPVCPSDC
ncbi:hypothetical protein G7Y89_g14169 [Neofusicoccum parvum]|nr:hypothetical protein G7Y89_g14169 [Neofusicoccum parvum]